MKNILPLLLLLLIASACLHKKDDIDLATNPYDFDTSAMLFDLKEITCIPTNNGSNLDTVVVKIRLFEEELQKLRESTDDPLLYGAPGMSLSTNSGYFDLLAPNSTPNSDVELRGTFRRKSGTVPMITIMITSKRRLYPEKIWSTWEYPIECN